MAACSYESLRTNLPREIMAFSDLPFTVEAMGGRSVDARRFPRHEEVRKHACGMRASKLECGMQAWMRDASMVGDASLQACV